MYDGMHCGDAGRAGRPLWCRAFAGLRARARECALEALAPTRCAGCERPGELICARCREALTAIDPVHACVRCGAPYGDVLCTECRPEEPGPARCLAAVVYEGPAPRIVRSYKDAGERRLAEPIAELMSAAAAHARAAAPERYEGLACAADGIVFVPVTAAAYQRRGFDHMERIARALARMTGVPVVDALVKHGSSDQRRLGRTGRAASATRAYEVVEDVAGARLLLVDDVITTGATLRAASRALTDAGAQTVDALAFARVW